MLSDCEELRGSYSRRSTSPSHTVGQRFGLGPLVQPARTSMVMSKINKVLVVMKKYHDSAVFYKCVGISLGGPSECEENVGQLPSLSLISPE